MSRSLVVFCFLLGLFTLSSAFYDSGSKVVKLTKNNFRDLVVNSKDLWFIEFYAPWCGHCQRLTPDWEKLAGSLEGIIKVGAVDMTTDQEAGAAYGIQGFPTLKFFGANKNSPQDYQGQRSPKDMMNFAFDNARRVAESRLGGGSSGSTGGNAGGQQGGGSCGGPQGGSGGNAGGSGGSGDDKDVVVLTDSNFQELVMDSDDLWLVEFYAPWCGHCKNLEPHWSKAATELKGQVKVGKVDATVQTNLAQKFGISAYPQIKLFPTGTKSNNLVEDYNGARDTGSIVSWANEKKSQFKPVQKVVQLVDQEVFDQNCANTRGVCFIAFLPHIYDSSVTERNNYIETFKKLAKDNRSNPVTFIWAQGGDYYSVEESLGLGSGYPALVAISVNKMKYAPLTGAFSEKSVETFVKSLLAGKQSLFNLKEVPKIKSVAAWDGKESKPKQEEL